MHYSQSSIEILRLNKCHRETVQTLCEECFPIVYPDWWYENILSDRVQFSLGAFSGDQLVGMIVAEYQTPKDAREQGKIPYSCTNYSVAYIISLGVKTEFRRQGIARTLMQSLFDSLKTGCKLVYLHVQSTNQAAIDFYQWQNFREHCKISSYYTINEEPADALVYTCSIHGGPLEPMQWSELFYTSFYTFYDWTSTQFRKMYCVVKRTFTYD